MTWETASHCVGSAPRRSLSAEEARANRLGMLREVEEALGAEAGTRAGDDARARIHTVCNLLGRMRGYDGAAGAAIGEIDMKASLIFSRQRGIEAVRESLRAQAREAVGRVVAVEEAAAG
jgi:hypothetical protein